jgi:hypothetical protein
MLWHLIINENSEEKLTTTITIKAEDWFSALQDGLDRFGVDGTVLSSLTCDVAPDNRVTVADALSRKVYLLEPVTPRDAKASRAADRDAAGGELPRHTVFFLRDEVPDDGSGIHYRERLISVDSAVSEETAARLAKHYFEQLHAVEGLDDAKRFITVHVYDHVFKERAERPAIAALSWREWHPGEPQILFPLSGEEGVTSSKSGADRSIRPTKAPGETARTPDSNRHSVDVSDRMITAFERMQEIFAVRHHDEAAAFVLSLSRELIPCESGRCMLMSPGKYELYTAATEGAAADVLKEQSPSLSKGIVGFTARNSATVVVNDPAGDDRFDDGLEALGESSLRSLLCAPVQYEGHLVGMLELVNSSRDGGFNSNDTEILSYLGTSFAEYVSTSLPSREADFTDREFSELALRKKKKKKKPANASGRPSPARKTPSEKKKKTKAAARSDRGDNRASKPRKSAVKSRKVKPQTKNA